MSNYYRIIGTKGKQYGHLIKVPDSVTKEDIEEIDFEMLDMWEEENFEELTQYEEYLTYYRYYKLRDDEVTEDDKKNATAYTEDELWA